MTDTIVEPGAIDDEEDEEERHFKRRNSPRTENPAKTTNDQKQTEAEDEELLRGKSADRRSMNEGPGHGNLFVNYLPPDYDEHAVREMFAQFGAIESSKVMMDFQTGLSRGFGFIKFKNPKDAQTAVQQMNGKKVGAKTLVVKYADNPVGTSTTPHGTPSPNLYIKGLPASINEDQLKSLFSPYGKIENYKILIDLQTGTSKGQAFVQFEQLDAAEYAISALNGYVFPGTAKGIVVRYADTQQEKSQRKSKFQRRKGNDRFTPYASVPMAPFIDPFYAAAAMQGESTLFIYHLPPSADDALLYRLFGPYGPILSVKVVKDKDGTPKGYGFVTMGNGLSALNAISALNGYRIDNKQLSVSFKK